VKKLAGILIFLLMCCAPARAQYTREVANIETWVQYAPAVVDFTLGFANNVKSDYTWEERAVKLAISYAAEIALTQSLKAIVKEQRPDGSAMNSFPSGHTATAFVGAELIRQDYGWWFGLGAYAVATGVGVMRVYHQRHWWWDVLAGAGIGVLSANIGNWVLKPIEDACNWHPGAKKVKLSVVPTADPFTKYYGTAIRVTF